MADANKALIVDGVAVNVCRQSKLDTTFPPDLASQFVTVPAEVDIQWSNRSGGWLPPAAVEPGPEPESGERLLPIAKFLLRFPIAKIAAVQASADPGVKAWLFVVDKLVNIDLNDPQTAGGLDYLISKNLINADDKAAALA